MDYFVVLQNGEETIYPEIQYIFDDDEFHPETDVIQQSKDDISLIVDLDEDGNVKRCQSISSGYQPLRISQKPQALGGSTDHTSHLLHITGVSANPPQQVSEDLTTALRQLEALESHHHAVMQALQSVEIENT